MNETSPNPETRIALFQRKEIRRTIHNNEWWFVITDVVAALTDSVDPQGYVKDMRRRDPELAKGWGQIATPLSVATPGGPQNLNCANTEGLFRIPTRRAPTRNGLTCDFTPVRTLAHPVSLETIKMDSRVAMLALVRQPRLAVMPVTETEFRIIVEDAKA